MPYSDDDITVTQATALLPAWVIPRMMTDVWSFGLLLTGGVVLAIDYIEHVQRGVDGSIWLDVHMLEEQQVRWIKDTFCNKLPVPITGAPVGRYKASINVAHVVWAFELADT
jgi:hypothetical protein